eukprot:92161-Rhodomonas_salina.1
MRVPLAGPEAGRWQYPSIDVRRAGKRLGGQVQAWRQRHCGRGNHTTLEDFGPRGSARARNGEAGQTLLRRAITERHRILFAARPYLSDALVNDAKETTGRTRSH